MDYVVLIEKAGENYSAYIPDLPSCIAAADTEEETERLIREGIAIYVEELQASGQPVSLPTTRALAMDVPTVA